MPVTFNEAIRKLPETEGVILSETDSKNMHKLPEEHIGVLSESPKGLRRLKNCYESELMLRC